MTAESVAGGESSPILCPSARCEEDAYLIGIVGADGAVGYVSPLLQIDASFVREAHAGRGPERRFRFAQACAEGGCSNWDGARCQVIDRAMSTKLTLNLTEDAGLPACGIRRSCRWFRQSGAEACRTCPLIVTDLPSQEMRSAALQTPGAGAT